MLCKAISLSSKWLSPKVAKWLGFFPEIFYLLNIKNYKYYLRNHTLKKVKPERWEGYRTEQKLYSKLDFGTWDIFVFCLFIYLWLCWVFVSVQGLSLVAASGGHSSLRCAGLSLSWPLLLRSTGSRRTGSAIVAHGPSRSAACGIFPDQGSNPCPLHWQADSQPLHHQGSPWNLGYFFTRLETVSFFLFFIFTFHQ